MEPHIIIAIIVVVFIILSQIFSFFTTLHEITKLRSYFPNKHSITIQSNSIKKEIIADDAKLVEILNQTLPGIIDEATIIAKGEDPKDYIEVPLVVCNTSNTCLDFIYTTRELNAYLCRNNDVAGADFAIIKDIYEDHLKSIQSKINNSLNTPLLLGLAGTFVGIIVGVSGLNLNDIFTGDSYSLNNLLKGVALAMSASFIGLCMTIWNTSVKYKEACTTCETDKENYFNILRRQLLPSLSTTMEQGLTSLKGVLGQFVSGFGNQLQGYTQAFQLMNDNIKQEHELLTQINQLNITKTSLSIARSFGKLKEASDELEVFHDYQQSLNLTINDVNTAIEKINSAIGNFEDFFKSLQLVVDNQNVASQMQRQFTEVIEQHFPLGSEGREMWRREYDMLVADAQKVSASLQNELQATTSYVKNFVEANKTTFSSLNELPAILSSVGKYAELQTVCYNDLRTAISNLIEQQQKNQIETAEMNKSILEALRTVVKTIKENR